MKLVRGSRLIPELILGSVATIGNFDGVHLGHQALLSQLRNKAFVLNLPLVVVLFEPQPAEYFLGLKAPSRISSLREKLDSLRKCGVDFVYCLKFDKKLSELPAIDFVNNYLFELLHVKYLLIGHDFRFGAKRLGNVDLLKTLAEEKKISIDTFAEFSIENVRVSSTKIRQALQNADLYLAKSYLGRDYSLCGRVIAGASRGRQWGIPTANVKMLRQNLPFTGVFCVHVKRKGRILEGVANLGRRPTVDGTKLILEVHLFDFNESLYGEIIEVFFLHKLRDEIQFSLIDALIKQIQDDIKQAKKYFLNNLAHIE
ncbi:riboflavin biosynthesis protein RibF (riboflavin kinase/FMN adenylyltransferase) [Legionella adelaidensis]|uniref:Riboflavin biosynthesis protein n=1 Tax=Legionella adelaidensis TaxID=45056 RepID=A0A0W0R408_9GAMM|nr:bifunctional riboflavin kinase/FAD synthetase [Legionella adelaidensis]KTC65772.1 riboflavin biosynthesis protein RibF (riboflavin kinase/FMN adenylyltransferase) [Legionella adelaidensis]